jgi:hypothetical protein
MAGRKGAGCIMTLNDHRELPPCARATTMTRGTPHSTQMHALEVASVGTRHLDEQFIAVTCCNGHKQCGKGLSRECQQSNPSCWTCLMSMIQQHAVLTRVLQDTLSHVITQL